MKVVSADSHRKSPQYWLPAQTGLLPSLVTVYCRFIVSPEKFCGGMTMLVTTRSAGTAVTGPTTAVALLVSSSSLTTLYAGGGPRGMWPLKTSARVMVAWGGVS